MLKIFICNPFLFCRLTGREFAVSEESDDLTIEQQVGKLIEQATLVENLCQLYVGWRPFW